MASTSSADIDSYLPRCGFKDVDHFDTLRKSNPFIFRVYTPKERSPFADDTDPFLVAPKFDELYARSPDDLRQITFPETLSGSYADVAKHMDWTTRSSSRYLSTSFSFGWAIWEAVKRYHSGMKKDVEIAIIDANALGGRAATAVELLLKSSPSERNEQFWKWHKFSKDSQSVLVYGFVPRSAVLASVPLLQILRKMPSYFLRDDIQVLPENPLTQAAWDYTNRKLSYRHFCQDMSKLFLSRPQEVQLRDTTGGAVRLALAFLRPYFHQVVQKDFEQAIAHLRRLAIIIARWPSESWIKEHPEVFNIVGSMALSLGEELLYVGRGKTEEISRLRVKIVGLEDALQSAHSSFFVDRDQVRAALDSSMQDVEDNDNQDMEPLAESNETLVNSDLLPPIELKVKKPLALETSTIPIFSPRTPITLYQTPITPPESPRNSIYVPSTRTTASENPDPTPATPPQPRSSLTWSSWVPPVDVSTAVSGVGSTFKLLPAFEMASPPSTPPPNVTRHVAFASPTHPILETVMEVDTEREDSEENVVIVDPQPPVLSSEDAHLHSIPEEEDESNESAEKAQPHAKDPVADERDEDGNHSEEEAESEDDDDEKTDFEDMGPQTPPRRHRRHRSIGDGTPGLHSPGVTSWIHIRNSSSALTSPRLSVCSMDTLIESSPEVFPKRGSISYPEPFSFLRRISSGTMVEGIRSRTVSFSGLSAATTEPVSEEGEDQERHPEEPEEEEEEPHNDDYHHPAEPLEPLPVLKVDLDETKASNIPLPPSPTSDSECTLSSLSSVSLTSPHSPASPESPESADGPISRVASTATEHGSISEHDGTSDIDVDEPELEAHVEPSNKGPTTIIPPKHGVSLLTPLEIADEDDDMLIGDRTTIVLADTASYIVTGFIVGAFITIFLFSTQRRALLTLT